MSQIEYIDVQKICPHPDNPRKDLGDLSELADSIRERGVLQNLTVVPKLGEITGEHFGLYTVIIGHRRLAAAKIAGLETVPCTVAEMTPKEQISTMLLENMQRQDLTLQEQAQGLQLMLDLGDSVEEISKQSGLSATTIRRRVRLMELDQHALGEACRRQVSIGDLDKLSQLSDVEARNRCLQEAGTNNFDQAVAAAHRRQQEAHNRGLINAEIKRLGAKKLAEGDRFSDRYTCLCELPVYDFEEQYTQIETDQQVYYILNGPTYYNAWVRFYAKRPGADKPKKQKSDIAREKRIKAAWEDLTALEDLHRQMRYDFVKKLRTTKDNQGHMLFGAALALSCQCCGYMNGNKQPLTEYLHLDAQYIPDLNEQVQRAYNANPAITLPLLIYAAFADTKSYCSYCGNNRKEPPEWRSCLTLNSLYAWLMRCGYRMSDDERQLQAGTHELFDVT